MLLLKEINFNSPKFPLLLSLRLSDLITWWILYFLHFLSCLKCKLAGSLTMTVITPSCREIRAVSWNWSKSSYYRNHLNMNLRLISWVSSTIILHWRHYLPQIIQTIPCRALSPCAAYSPSVLRPSSSSFDAIIWCKKDFSTPGV